MKHLSHILFFIVAPFFGLTAQIPTTVDTTSRRSAEVQFKNLFFEAIKQRGIENYPLAIRAIDKAQKLPSLDAEQQTALAYERGKNQLAMGNYNAAEEAFLFSVGAEDYTKASQEGLYTVYHEQGDYNQALPIVRLLARGDAEYLIDVVKIHIQRQDFKPAIALLDSLDQQWGESLLRQHLRQEVYKNTKDTGQTLDLLEQEATGETPSQQHYLNKVYALSEQNKEPEAFAVALSWQKDYPNSGQAQFALYKFYMDQNNIDQALESMNMALNDRSVQGPQLLQLIKDYLSFLHANPQYEWTLNRYIAVLSERQDADTNQLLGQYFVAKGGITQGLDYLQKALDLDPMNHTIYIQMASLNYQTQQYDRGLIYAEQGLSLFPAQSVFYLLTARGHKEKGALKQALSYLEMGLDYVLDHEREGRLIYQEGAAIYQALGQDTNAELWRQKGQIKNNE
jgi:tetratricopeptide (TPR) repeat protein